MAYLLLDTFAAKVAWGVAIVALFAVFVCALRAWWSELREVEDLASNVRPNLNQFKHGVKR